MYSVDLNSDLGESFGSYTIGLDSEILKYVTSANIACGYHAGDPVIMDKTVKLANNFNVAIGAHPGFNDLMGFGRRNMNLSFNELKMYVKYQLGALIAIANVYGQKVQHVKPHGALYNMAAVNKEYAKAICEAIIEVDENIILLALANSEMIQAGKDLGLKTANEIFADRAYLDDGTLVPRNIEGAVIHDTELATQRVIEMIKTHKVKSINGNYINIQADSICVHGDNPKAVEFVKNIKHALEQNDIKIINLHSFIK